MEIQDPTIRDIIDREVIPYMREHGLVITTGRIALAGEQVAKLMMRLPWVPLYEAVKYGLIHDVKSHQSVYYWIQSGKIHPGETREIDGKINISTDAIRRLNGDEDGPKG